MLIVLYIVATLNVAVLSFYAFLGLANPKRSGSKRSGPKRAAERANALAYSSAMRTIPLGLATVGAIAFGAREAFIWLAGVGCVIQLLDSLPGQVQRDPSATLRPLAIGLVQLVVLAIVLATSNEAG